MTILEKHVYANALEAAKAYDQLIVEHEVPDVAIADDDATVGSIVEEVKKCLNPFNEDMLREITGKLERSILYPIPYIVAMNAAIDDLSTGILGFKMTAESEMQFYSALSVLVASPLNPVLVEWFRDFAFGLNVDRDTSYLLEYTDSIRNIHGIAMDMVSCAADDTDTGDLVYSVQIGREPNADATFNINIWPTPMVHKISGGVILILYRINFMSPDINRSFPYGIVMIDPRDDRFLADYPGIGYLKPRVKKDIDAILAKMFDAAERNEMKAGVEIQRALADEIVNHALADAIDEYSTFSEMRADNLGWILDPLFYAPYRFNDEFLGNNDDEDEDEVDAIDTPEIPKELYETPSKIAVSLECTCCNHRFDVTDAIEQATGEDDITVQCPRCSTEAIVPKFKVAEIKQAIADSVDTDMVIADELGGRHSSGTGWAPDGSFCGECSNTTCVGCYVVNKPEAAVRIVCPFCKQVHLLRISDIAGLSSVVCHECSSDIDLPEGYAKLKAGTESDGSDTLDDMLYEKGEVAVVCHSCGTAIPCNAILDDYNAEGMTLACPSCRLEIKITKDRINDIKSRLIGPDPTVTVDTVGGRRVGGYGWSPNGTYCGACTEHTCEGCGRNTTLPNNSVSTNNSTSDVDQSIEMVCPTCGVRNPIPQILGTDYEDGGIYICPSCHAPASVPRRVVDVVRHLRSYHSLKAHIVIDALCGVHGAGHGFSPWGDVCGKCDRDSCVGCNLTKNDDPDGHKEYIGFNERIFQHTCEHCGHVNVFDGRKLRGVRLLPCSSCGEHMDVTPTNLEPFSK